MNYNHWTYKRFGRGVGNIILPLSSKSDSDSRTYPQSSSAFVSGGMTILGLTGAIIILLMILNLSFQSKIKPPNLGKSNTPISLNIVESTEKKLTPSPTQNGPAILSEITKPTIKRELQAEKAINNELADKPLQEKSYSKKEPTQPTVKKLISETHKVEDFQPEATSIATPERVSEPVFQTLNIDEDFNKISSYRVKNNNQGIQAEHSEQKQINSRSIAINNIKAPATILHSSNQEGIRRVKSEVAKNEIQSRNIHIQADLQRSVSNGPPTKNTPIEGEDGVADQPHIAMSLLSALPEMMHEVAYSSNKRSAPDVGIESRVNEEKKAEIATFPKTEFDTIAVTSSKKITKSDNSRRTRSKLNIGIASPETRDSDSAKIKAYVAEAPAHVENSFSGDRGKISTGKGVKAAATLKKVLIKTDDFPVCLGLEEDSRIMSKIVRILKKSPNKRICTNDVGTFSFTGDLRIMALSVKLKSSTKVNFTNQCEFLSSALNCLANER